MKKLFTYLSASLVVFVYVLSYIGFGIHTCTCSGTTDVILLFNNLSCDSIHHAHIHVGHHECDHHECAHHECDHHSTGEAGCCHTEILVLTDAQDNRIQTDLISVDYQTLGHVIYETGWLLAHSFSTECDSYAFIPYPPLDAHAGSGVLSMFGQRRL